VFLTPSARRVAALAPVYAHGASRRLNVVVALWLAGLIGLFAGVGWEEGAACPSLFGAPLPGFGGGRSREQAVELLLAELFSWAWLAVGALYLLPSVLIPLAGSFSVSSTMWARLSPATPREVAAARLARAVPPAALLALLGLSWAAACAAAHDIPAAGLLGHAMGPAAHLLCAAGVVVLLGPRVSGDPGRVLLAFLACLAPVALFLLFVTFAARWQSDLRPWWPYACPFAAHLGDQGQHVAATAALGAALLVLSVVCRGGRVVHPAGFPGPENVG
jgi:hypothetical protein